MSVAEGAFLKGDSSASCKLTFRALTALKEHRKEKKIQKKDGAFLRSLKLQLLFYIVERPLNK